MVEKREFSISGYIDLLKEFISRGYEFRLFTDGRPMGKQVFLRHDVDLDLGCAVELARLEQSAGVKSTYFILVNTFFYNPASAESRAIIREIGALGHSIGLHFDAKAYVGADDALVEERAAQESRMLEEIAETHIRCLSFHRPAAGVLGSRPEIGGMINCYSKEFMKAIAYCSDSQGVFRFGHPLDHEALASGSPMQLVLHPIWWVTEGNASALSRLEEFREMFIHRLDSAMHENLMPWRQKKQAASGHMEC